MRQIVRQVVLDTETTGISYESGHKLIEIGCLELVDRQLTGKQFHTYLNPQREIEPGAFKIHGLSNTFLENKPIFKDVVEDFIKFIKGTELIIHNAQFDLGFINAELKLLNWPQSIYDYCTVFDTLLLARNKHPGQKNNLDALCKRYAIDNSDRTLHGALVDAKLLALLYIALTGGQADLFAADEKLIDPSIHNNQFNYEMLTAITPIIYPDETELKHHENFIKFIKNTSGINRWD